MRVLLFVGALAVSALTIVPTVSSAATATDGRLVERVAYADLDLGTLVGKARLDRRIDVAIRKVCQRPNNAADLKASMAYDECADKAYAAIKKSVAMALAARAVARDA